MSDRASADIRPDIGRYPVGHRPIPAAIIKLMIRQFKTRVYIFFKNKKNNRIQAQHRHSKAESNKTINGSFHFTTLTIFGFFVSILHVAR